MKYKKFVGSLLVCASSWAVANLAFAGAADMQSSDGNKMKFEYEGDKLRINTGQEGSYMVINNDGMYVVSDAGGTPMVIDAGKMMGMFGDMAATAPSVASSEVVTLKATGRYEENAGIKGEIYKLEYIDNSSKDVQTTELVLSDDPRAKEMSKAISGFAAAMVKAIGQDPKGANDLEKQMDKLNKGVLRYGDDMRVTAISTRSIASDRFVLPAAPTDLSSMSGFADAIKANSGQATTSGAAGEAGEKTEKKGLVSGFLSSFGKKANEQSERQQDRADEKADDAVDEATDEAVDNVLDKAFGKLFGK